MFTHVASAALYGHSVHGVVGARGTQLLPVDLRVYQRVDRLRGSGRPRAQHEPDLHAPDTAAQNVRTFEADELLDKVRDELEALRGVLLETHALPTCDVFETLAVPESRWKKLPRSPSKSSTRSGPLVKARTAWPEVAEMIAEARDAPPGHASHRYLAAQVVDWKGHVVVTVFAHAALEGKIWAVGSDLPPRDRLGAGLRAAVHPVVGPRRGPAEEGHPAYVPQDDGHAHPRVPELGDRGRHAAQARSHHGPGQSRDPGLYGPRPFMGPSS
ncbi:hypothetical protein ACFV90_40640 [Streptomyces sp. NPDC059904]|uniref:hypothetical protein n=1 Tax=unclassified Streptomyces TaxID=2593676 RepID=UPI003663272B